jgi:hypothetical protein
LHIIAGRLGMPRKRRQQKKKNARYLIHYSLIGFVNAAWFNTNITLKYICYIVEDLLFRAE